MALARALLLTLADNLSVAETPLLINPLIRASPICEYQRQNELSVDMPWSHLQTSDDADASQWKCMAEEHLTGSNKPDAALHG